MRIPGVKRARLAARWLRSRGGSRTLVLGYHSVSDDPFDPYSIAVTPVTFAAQLSAIRRVGEPVSLTTVCENLRAGSLGHGGVALTFDDGYADVLTTALPLLEQYEIPATVFVISGMLDTELWWDRLARIIPRGQMDISLVKGTYQRLAKLSPARRAASLEELEEELAPAGADLPARRTLSLSELQQLERSDLIEIGSHTVSHEPAARLSASELDHEFAHSKVSLESALSGTVRWLSYPNGSWTPEAKSTARRAGYEAAFSSENDVVSASSDRMCLPRFWPGNSDGAAFESWLRRWL